MCNSFFMKKVLFVCSGNTFRSASAEYLLRKFLQDEKDASFSVHSAGTTGNSVGVFDETISEVKKFGIDMSKHQQRVLSQEIIDDSNIIICMTHKHQNIVLENFNRESFLFEELALHLDKDLKDDAEARGEYKDLNKFIDLTIDFIHECIPRVYFALKKL